jgi:hypothetical protein
MLSPGEEERLLFLLETDRKRVVNQMIVNPTAYAITYLWLAEKLKEANDELKENEELRKKLIEVETFKLARKPCGRDHCSVCGT